MPIEMKKHLFEIRQAIKAIEEFTNGLDYAGFLEKGVVQAAVERKFEIIGEALIRIRRVDPSVLEQISEHQRIIGFRNILIHGYDIIDSEIFWDAIINHLAKLKAEIESMLEA